MGIRGKSSSFYSFLKVAGVYIHIPYCKSKCSYCDFYSTPQVTTISQYVDALLVEAKLRASLIGDAPIKTLYIGGGTPSVMPTSLLQKLVHGLSDILDLSQVEEFTIEVNPDDVTVEYVIALRQLGINRVSMGVQSFIDSELRAINRRHSSQQAINAATSIKAGGINNVSIDLIYGLPGQTLTSWQLSINQALALEVQHISAYNLSYEPGTRLWVMREKGRVQEVSDDECIAMYDYLVNILKSAGYEHYEISNFALPGYRSRHNSSYWNFTPYLGLGAAAHSFDGTARSYNPSNLKLYIESLDSGKTAFVEENLEWWERHDEEVMVRLRTCDGLDTALIREHYGEKAYNSINEKSNKFLVSGLLEKHGDTLVLTHKGVMVSDTIIRTLMWD